MGKRFFLSLFLIIIVVTAIIVGSTLFFSMRYDTMSAEDRLVSASPSPDVPEPEEDDTAENQNFGDSDFEADVPLPPAQQSAASPTTDGYGELAKAKVSEMTLDQKICQMLFVTQEALTGYSTVTQSGSATEYAISQYPVGGIIYFAQNLVSTDQVKSMIENIQSYSEIGLFIGVDEEGGSVARVADCLGTTAFPDMSEMGAAGDTQAVYDMAVTQAGELKALGFNVNFSPCADVLSNDENTVVRDRSFGKDPSLVSSMVSNVVKGLSAGGMLCAPKHFPGHGSTGGDTHNGYAASDRTFEDLMASDIRPFQAAIDAGAPMIMVGHMTMTEIDAEHPASLSSAIVTGILRAQMDYDGIIITDAINMSAVTDSYSYAQATVAAIAAGCDMVLGVSNIADCVSAVEAAVSSGTISEKTIDESVTRILTAKLRYGILS